MDYGLDYGNTYYYHVTAVYDEGESDPSNTVEVAPLLPSPRNLSAIVGDQLINLFWQQPLTRFSGDDPSSSIPMEDTLTRHSSANRNSRELQGYNLYRDGTIINTQMILETTYEDTDKRCHIPVLRHSTV